MVPYEAVISYKAGGPGRHFSFSLSLATGSRMVGSALPSLWTVLFGPFVFWQCAAAQEFPRLLWWDCHMAVALCVHCFVGFFIIVVATVCLLFLAFWLNCSYPNLQVLPLFSDAHPHLTGGSG